MKELLKSYKKDVLSIPNILSYIRILIIPLYLYVYICAENKYWYAFAAVILILSGLTDMLDGIIARKFNMITELGKLLDPCADKLTQLAVVVSLVFRYNQMIFLIILLIIKEATMGIACYIVYKKKKRKMNGSKWYGKINTTIFYLIMIILVLFYSIPENIASFLIGFSSGFMIVALIMYLILFVKMFKNENID